MSKLLLLKLVGCVVVTSGLNSCVVGGIFGSRPVRIPETVRMQEVAIGATQIKEIEVPERDEMPNLPEPPDRKEERLISPPDPEVKYPTALKVPGREGMVFNPYTNAMIDVTGLKGGTLVKAPDNPEQLFYVPK